MRLQAVAHMEEGCHLGRPRHPMVCTLDVTGFFITVAFLALYPQKFVVAALPICIVMLYAVSCAYHWLPVHWVRQRLDYLMIAAVIAATYIPFWGNTDLLPWEVAAPRFLVVGAILACTVVVRLFFPLKQALGAGLYLLLGGYGAFVSAYELSVWLPPEPLVAFWTGTTLYVLQFVVYAAKWPNPLPERFGYRESQHVLLLLATTLHTWAVLKYL